MSARLICADGWLFLIVVHVVFDWVGLHPSKTSKLILMGGFNLVFEWYGPSCQPPPSLILVSAAYSVTPGCLIFVVIPYFGTGITGVVLGHFVNMGPTVDCLG